MTVHTFPNNSRPLPADADRALWCGRCDMLVRIGVTPILHVSSCSRCAEPYEALTWRVVMWWALFASAVWALAIWAAL